MSVNKVILVGRVGENPELKDLSGSKVVNFSLATSEKFKDKNGEKKENTEWHRVTAWGALAEIIAKYATKGQQLYVEGKIQTRTYDDKDGVKKYSTEIVAKEITLLGSKGSGDSTATSTPAAANTSAPASTGKGTSNQNSNTNAPVVHTVGGDDDDLPF